MDDQQTCGKGLAQNSVFPTSVGEIIGAIANMLETHLKALDMSDPVSRPEYEAYTSLARQHRQVATELESVGREMAGYRTLPMAKHDMRVMAAPETREAFASVVKREEELLTLLQQRVDEHRQMLKSMGG